MQSQSRSERTTAFSPPIALRYGIGILASLALLATIFLLRPYLVRAASHLMAPDPVTTAWEKAKAAGSYHFTSDITQVTLPVATIANVGRSSRTEKYYLEGQNNLRQNQLELKLWSDGGSILQDASGIGVKV